MFSQEPFAWDPRFNETAAFTFGGLAVMTPAVIIYNLFNIEEAKQEEDEQRLIEQFSEALERETSSPNAVLT